MNKLAIATVAVILCSLVAFSEAAVIIKNSKATAKSSEYREPSAIAAGSRTITVLQSDDKSPKKRDSPPGALVDQVGSNSKNGQRSTFSINQRRPCTFCKFFSTTTPMPSPKMQFKFVQV